MFIQFVNWNDFIITFSNIGVWVCLRNLILGIKIKFKFMIRIFNLKDFTRWDFSWNPAVDTILKKLGEHSHGRSLLQVFKWACGESCDRRWQNRPLTQDWIDPMLLKDASTKRFFHIPYVDRRNAVCCRGFLIFNCSPTRIATQ